LNLNETPLTCPALDVNASDKRPDSTAPGQRIVTPTF